MTRLSFLLCLVFATSTCADEDPRAAWDLEVLFKAPNFEWDVQDGPVHSLLYNGLPVRGEETEVFAFYASPRTLDPTKAGPFPGVVLIHGGGGTAFAEWVWLWAERGYAAIAMDLSGRRPPPARFEEGRPVPNQAGRREERTRLTKGGLDHTHSEKFEAVRTPDRSDDWPHHAAANAILAHSLLRDLPEVDAERTAVTGISWGGYTTCLTASLDSRFKAAVPVYGCGFLFEGESVQKPHIDALEAHRRSWIDQYDPSSLLRYCEVPLLFVNGSNDKHYPLDSYQKSFDVVPGPKQMRIEIQMGHSHPAGWAPREIGDFIDARCLDGTPLPRLSNPVIEDGRVTVQVGSPLPLAEAWLHYTEDEGPRASRSWKKLQARIKEGAVEAPRPPDSANTWLISLTDDQGRMVSSTVQFQP